MTCAPRRSCAASPIEPADQPDADDGDLHAAGARETLAGDRRDALHLLEVGGEAVGLQLLRPVADRLLRARVDLDDDAVGARRRGRQRQRQHQVAPARRRGSGRRSPAGARARLSTGTAMMSSVKRYAVSNVRMPRSHSITFGLPSLSTYSAAISSSSSVAESPRLISTGRPGAADLGQQRVVLHVARADLDHVGHFEHRLDVARVHQLGDDRQPGLLLGLGEQAQALRAEPLEAVRRRARLVGAAAEHRRAGSRPPVRDADQLVARLDRAGPGDQREVVAADLVARRSRSRCPTMRELGRGELVGLAGSARPAGRRRGPRGRGAATCSRSPIAPITVTSSPRDGCARAPTLSMRAMTAWMSSSVAVGFMTIIIWLLLKGTWTETVRRVRAPALGPSAPWCGRRVTRRPSA